MHFLINGSARARKKVKRRRTRAKATTKRRRRRSTLSKGGTVAKRRRRRRAVSKATPRRRRRRRNPGALARARANPPRRRRRRRRAASARRTVRRYKRNPGMSTRGIVGNIVQGLKDGGAVVLGEVGARKVRGAITGMLPANVQAQVASGMGKLALSIASSLAVSMVVRRVLPGQARMVTAGAFAESINCALATTPLAPYLAAYPPRRIVAAPAGRMSAWPGTGNSRISSGQQKLAAYPIRSVGMPSNVGI